nr:uncharacterized protein LOC795664 isoform X3 [Danio rerio]|eukprot:XP_009296936.1 uncharacterized protein LOC795664 isoform X3 [Danio rerio]
MFKLLLLLLAVAGLHARPLHRLPNGKLKQISPEALHNEHGDNSVLKDIKNTDLKPRKQIPAPAEFCRQGTDASRRFLTDLNTKMLKHPGDKNTRVSAPLDAFRQGTENQLAVLQDLRSRHMMNPQYSIQSEKHEQRNIPAEIYRQGTEPSRNILMDLNTGLLKEQRNQMDRRVAGSAKWAVVSEHEDINSQDSSEQKENRRAAPVEDRRQGTEPSRRFLIDLNTGMPKEEESEMSRRVSGFYNPAPYEMRMGTQNSHSTLVDPRTGQLLPTLTEQQRSTAPLDEFRQGTEYQPSTLQELRLKMMQKQSSRNTLMDLNTGRLKEHHSSAKWAVVSEHEDINSQDSSEQKEDHRAAPVEDRRQGTEPSRRFLIDLNTGMPKEEESEMSRRVSGFYNPAAVEKRQGTEPSRRFLVDMNTGMLQHTVGEMNRRVSGFYNPAPYEMRMGTQNSHSTLVDPRTGQLLPTLTEQQRSTAPLDEFRQGTEYQPVILHELRLNMMHKQHKTAQLHKLKELSISKV